MLAALIVLASAVTALVLILLCLVAAGIRREPPAAQLGTEPPSLTAAMVRRLLGVYTRRPEPLATSANRHQGTGLTGYANDRHDGGR